MWCKVVVALVVEKFPFSPQNQLHKSKSTINTLQIKITNQSQKFRFFAQNQSHKSKSINSISVPRIKVTNQSRSIVSWQKIRIPQRGCISCALTNHMFLWILCRTLLLLLVFASALLSGINVRASVKNQVEKGKAM